MKIWKISGIVTVSVSTEVEAETEDEARELAMLQEMMPIAAWGIDESDYWVCSDLPEITEITGIAEGEQ